MSETPAKGKTGFLLYNPFKKNHFFRIYHAPGKFTDYDLCVEDLEITIEDRFVALYEGERNMLNYTSKVLGKSVSSPAETDVPNVVPENIFDDVKNLIIHGKEVIRKILIP